MASKKQKKQRCYIPVIWSTGETEQLDFELGSEAERESCLLGIKASRDGWDGGNSDGFMDGMRTAIGWLDGPIVLCGENQRSAFEHGHEFAEEHDDFELSVDGMNLSEFMKALISK